MSSLKEIQSARYKKLALLAEFFGQIYPARTRRTHSVAEAIASFPKLAKDKKHFTLAGRVRALRPHGGSTFFDIEEDGKTFQAFLREEDLDKKLYALFGETIDIGDIVEITGTAYRTKRKEKSILVSEWRPLAKTLRPLPEKWHGLQDIEERYRTRALDLLSNQHTREVFITRARIITFLRSFFNTLGFLEVDTPILHPIPGGATARPFRTHHNALDADLYLRIAPELYLKRLLVGGYMRVYEIARNFRNEGIDITHNPEFTMVEAYMAYGDSEEIMKIIETMIRKLVRTLFKKKEFNYQGKLISVGTAYKRITFADAIKYYALLPHIETISKEDLSIAAKRFGIEIQENASRAVIMEDIFRKAVRPHLVQPTFVTAWPAALLPLAKRQADNPDIADSFQLYIGGIELVKGFSELNDPQDQKKRFEEQETFRKKGNEEASPSDQDYIENLEYGMPPAGGFGMGVDRLCLLMTNNHNIREVILFPTLRPK